MIDEIMLRITSSLNLESTLAAIVDAAARLASADYASIYLRDEDGSYRARAAYGVPLERLQAVVLTTSEGLLREMSRTGKPAQTLNILEEVHSTPRARTEVQQTGARATLGIPLMRDSDCVGALYVALRDSHGETSPFSSGAMEGLLRLAAFAQVAVHNARRFSSVEAERSQLQAYVDAIPEGVIIFDRSGGVVLVNETMKRDIGALGPTSDTPMEAILGALDTWKEGGIRVGSHIIRSRFDAAATFRRVLTTSHPEQGLLEMENDATGRGEPHRTFEVHFNPLRGEGGSIDGIVATLRDITIPLRYEREGARTKLLAQLLDLSVVLNSDLSVSALTEHVVEAAMELLGAQAGTLGLLEGDPTTDSGSLVFRRFHLHDGWVDFNFTLHSGEGAPGHVWATMTPYVSNDCAADSVVLADVQKRLGFRRLVCVPVVNRSGRLIGTLGVYDPKVERDFEHSDVEALQMLAHQVSIAIENARLSELKDAFLSIVSHELKTPVTSIKGFAQVLQRRLPPESLLSAGRYLTVINQQADRLNALINDLLDLSRIQTGRFNFETATIDYSQIVREVTTEMQLILPQNTILLSASDGVSVGGNANRLRQVLVNLIDNAVKHGPVNGRVHVTVESADGMVVTSVRDEGGKLPPGEVERIFSPYYQVHAEASQHTRGLGLGLFISRQIVEEHGGRIWVDATERTSFCFTIPARYASTEGEPASPVAQV